MSPLESRCRRLLLAYPATYRTRRGDEILDTVIESSPSGRIGWREARSLVMGGLRVRAAQHRRLRTPTNLRLAALFGLISFFITSGARALWWVALPRVESSTTVGDTVVFRRDYFDYPSAGRLIYLLLAASVVLALVVAAWFARTRTVAVLATLCAVPYVVDWDNTASPVRLLALLAVVALHRGAARMPHAWLVLAGLLTLQQFMGAAWFLPYSVSETVLRAIGALLLLWAVLDGRPLLGAAFFFLFIEADVIWEQLVRAGSTDPWWVDYTTGAVAIAVLVPAFLRVRRQAVL